MKNLLALSAQLLVSSAALATPPPPNLLGRASVQLTLDREGRVTVCSVTRSSGSADVDNATCRALRSARFPPATDAKGKRISSTMVIADAVITPPR